MEYFKPSDDRKHLKPARNPTRKPARMNKTAGYMSPPPSSAQAFPLPLARWQSDCGSRAYEPLLLEITKRNLNRTRG